MASRVYRQGKVVGEEQSVELFLGMDRDRKGSPARQAWNDEAKK